jgi:hypothetical protein
MNNLNRRKVDVIEEQRCEVSTFNRRGVKVVDDEKRMVHHHEEQGPKILVIGRDNEPVPKTCITSVHIRKYV